RVDSGARARGDADASLDPTSPLAVDAITVSPFLGLESVQPFVDVARHNDARLLLLALTSHPGVGPGQSRPPVRPTRGPARGRPGPPGAPPAPGAVLARLAELNAGAEPLGSFG